MATVDSEPRGETTPASERARVAILSIVLCVVVLVVGFGGFELLSLLKKPPDRAAVPPVRTAVHVMPAVRGEFREMLTGYGRARALRRAEVPAEIGAVVRWVSPSLEAGLTVREGDELVRLDPRDAAAAADQAAARMAQAEAQRARARSDRANLAAQIEVAERELETAQRELARTLELEARATSASEVDGQRMSVQVREQAVLVLKGRSATSAADESAADAEIAAARSALEKAQNDLARATVRAPYDGTIIERTAQPGERVAPGTPLFSIVDLRHVEVPVSLPASRHGEVAVGARADVRLREGGDVVWSGTVARVSPRVDPERRVFEVFLDVVSEDDGAAAPIAPGAFVVATVEGKLTEDVIAVPREAFVAGAVYVAEPDGERDETTGAVPAVTRERTPVVARRMPETVLLSGGVEPGELIVVTGVSEVAEGARVLVLDDPDAAAGAER